MGTNSRERNKAKKKARGRREARRFSSSRSFYCEECGTYHREFARQDPPSPEDLAAGAIWSAIDALRLKSQDELDDCLAVLAVDEPADWPAIAERVLRRLLDQHLEAAWAGGWQPRDLARLVERDLKARPGRMIRDLIAAERARYATGTVSEAWDEQLSALDARVWWPSEASYLDRFAERERIDRVEAIRSALETMDLLRRIPRIPLLGPAPGDARRGSLGPELRATNSPDSTMLHKVRALLAKAESTEYEEEASSLTAKAQELMTRHSIDYALLASTKESRDEPVGIRIPIDNPYDEAKAALLDNVAKANSCRPVYSKHLGFSTVIGLAADVAAVELLFTSLLVQGTAAMMRTGSHDGSDRRSRSRSFRQSFLYAYASRIGERLQAAADEIYRTAAKDRGVALVPVMRAKTEAVDAKFDSLMGDVTFRSYSINNAHGWAAGTAAADLANVDIREQVHSAAHPSPNGDGPRPVPSGAAPAQSPTLW